MGVNQSYQGVRTAQSIINLALITGNMGRPGTGRQLHHRPVQRDGLAPLQQHDQPAGRPRLRESRRIRETVAQHAGPRCCRSFRIAGELGLQRASSRGFCASEIKGLWIVCHQYSAFLDQPGAGPGRARPSGLPRRTGHVRLDRDGADGRRGAAGRRLGREGRHLHQLGAAHRHASARWPDAPGQAHCRTSPSSSWWPSTGDAEETFRAWESPAAAVFEILKRLSAGQPCDITGIAGYDDAGSAAEASSGRVLAGEPPPPPRSHGAAAVRGRSVLSSGRPGQAALRGRPARCLSRPTDRFPLILLTGRGSAAQWHTQTRTAKSAVLRKLYPAQIYVESTRSTRRPAA